jgi:hypothetical protein
MIAIALAVIGMISFIVIMAMVFNDHFKDANGNLNNAGLGWIFGTCITAVIGIGILTGIGMLTGIDDDDDEA